MLLLCRSTTDTSESLYTDKPIPSKRSATSTKSSPDPEIRSTEHVKLVKYQTPSKQIVVEASSPCCNDLIDLRLECVDGNFVDEGSLLRKKTFQRNINVFIATLDIKLPLDTLPIDNNAEVKSFDDECVFIAKILSVKDKLIYAVLPITLGDFVVPLIHNHRCVEKIYLHQQSGDTESTDWIKEYPKIGGNGSSIDLLKGNIIENINIIMKRPSRWSRSKTLLNQLSSQKSKVDSLVPIKRTVTDDLITIRIFILFIGSRQPFHLSHSKIEITEFDDIAKCNQSIQNSSSTPVYLIISMGEFQDIQSIVELDPVHAVYIVIDPESSDIVQSISSYSKLSGIFVLNEDLLDQLTRDICFHRQISFRLPTMNIFKLESNILSKLNERQKDFLCFQLFSGILSELPLPSTTITDSNIHIKDGHFLADIIEANTKINYLFKDFSATTLQNSVITLKEIDQRIASLPKDIDSTSDTVYRAQIVSKQDLEMLQANSDTLLAIQTFVLASRSFQSIVDICRQAVDNELSVVLFELKLSDHASVASLDPDTVIFSLGTLFRLVSTEPGPGGVWHAQLELADGNMNSITNRLRSEIGGHLTWLTFGNYLTAFKRFDTANNYYEYLLLVLPSDHSSRLSIYNNMGLMYAERNNHTEALKFFKKATTFPVNNLAVEAEQKFQSTACVSTSQSSTPSKIDTLQKIAEMSYAQGNQKTALEYYRRAQDIATDATLRQFYQEKIDKILYSDDLKKT
ncbi:unnamed protein product [Rotaria magnacalcarata]|uniref:Uncharacterized protein n=1 Tax=Rotaria magnacalcarata TaxID=392030 RepID=A0A819IVQ5_9BILA|nr:unnamed protein product [Rotaria magnacalcarata]CAF3917896.1 unnamed protein product [Rotaria magnacalcarata]